MIQIDDAGSGSFVGGTCIGFYRPETNEYFFDIIPVDLYRTENFKKKFYLEKVTEIAIIAFHHLAVQKNETIEICRGYMFENLRKWLTNNDYCLYSTQITGRAQEVVEKSFELYSVQLGLPEMYIKYTQYPFHFHKLLRWVFADFDNRIKLCKTGWKCWEKIKGIQPDISTEIVSHFNLFCLKCGKAILHGSKAITLRFISNKENRVYLHDQCYPLKNG